MTAMLGNLATVSASQHPPLDWGQKGRQSALTWVMTLAVLVLAIVFRDNTLVVSVSVAALGGFVHEIAQSGGSVAYPQMKDDGLYLGSISGLLFGAIAGLLAVQAFPAGTQVDVRFVSQMFFSGLALKGLAEAVGGQAKTK